jgi:hypothetical protein
MLRVEDIGVTLGEAVFDVMCPCITRIIIKGGYILHVLSIAFLRKQGSGGHYSRDNKYVTMRDFRPPSRSR